MEFLLILRQLRGGKALCVHVCQHGTGRMDIATALVRHHQAHPAIKGTGQG
jgi:hypothetical protein